METSKEIKKKERRGDRENPGAFVADWPGRETSISSGEGCLVSHNH